MTKAKWEGWDKEKEAEEGKTRTVVMREVIDKKRRSENIIQNWTLEIL